jgi:hypothetical protein
LASINGRFCLHVLITEFALRVPIAGVGKLFTRLWFDSDPAQVVAG